MPKKIVIARSSAAACAAGLFAAAVASSVAARAQGAAPDAAVAAPAQSADDERRFMHGIGTAGAPAGKTWVFFSSSGLPPRGANRDGSWPHDVYVGEWSSGDPHLARMRIFIRRPEAQEPVSVAQNTRGNIFVTFEDGWDAPRSISQRYGVYRKNLTPIRPYPQDVRSGGHSGHVAAIGEQFVVVYSEGWLEGGGLNDKGTGDGVYASVYDGRGRLLRHVAVAVHARQDWPVIAGSARSALVVWQKYIPPTSAMLEYALLDPSTGKLTRPAPPIDPLRAQDYAYAAAYVPAIDRFMVVATRDSGRAVAFLIDGAGGRTAELDCLPAVMRESDITVDGQAAYLPTQDGRLMTLALQGDSITLRGMQQAPFAWGSAGITGIVSGTAALHVVSLSRDGLREADFDTRNGVAAAPTTSGSCPRRNCTRRAIRRRKFVIKPGQRR
ncbi:hypothetical protein JQ625_25235 [Bradyrhizobium diazoefficiens]|nr:hypothetical protein [Bradyrhizobium diazoefficiens]MBR0778149.1 hypothetical protein [Bradyrhizobium diazoefficiens]